MTASKRHREASIAAASHTNRSSGCQPPPDVQSDHHRQDHVDQPSHSARDQHRIARPSDRVATRVANRRDESGAVELLRGWIRHVGSKVHPRRGVVDRRGRGLLDDSTNRLGRVSGQCDSHEKEPTGGMH